jgi:formate hydrogenlyase subunit 3/multisubunit Na+/H+ antiporter MnhD subunit
VVDILELLAPNNLLTPLVLPAVVGLLIIFIPKKVKWIRELLALATTAYIFYTGIKLFGMKTGEVSLKFGKLGPLELNLDLLLTPFVAFIVLFILFSGFAITLYSIGYYRREGANPRYYGFLLWTLSSAVGAVLSDNLLMLLIFWELVTLLLYLLVNMGQNKEEKAAAKLFAILGFTEAAMTFGIILIGLKYGTLSISQLHIQVGDIFSTTAFLFLFIAAIAKAGAMPVHTWLPSIAQSAPTPIMAFLPAALDKLLGIYFLTRIALDIFSLDRAMSLLMMIIGAVTIFFAVMMALIQHDLKKLLSFHAVSQVGYMVLGIGTGSVIGILGGIFHMLNNSLYKTLLFLNAGAIEKRTGTTDLSKLGGLAKYMPITFITCVVASFSISGVPPFNGFMSKWMIYQGIIDSGGVIFLVAAMFGSALTLASFIKVLHSTFLGSPAAPEKKYKEVSWSMWLPMLALAVLCILFGVFASYPLNNYITTVEINGQTGPDLLKQEIGIWSPGLATALILTGLFIGIVIFYLGKVKKIRRTSIYIGGEKPDMESMRFTGTDFYETIRNLKIIKTTYRDAESGSYDLYNFFGQIGSFAVKGLKWLHNGVLSNYLSWCLIGLVVLIFILW